MNKPTIAQLRQIKEREMMKEGVSPVCLAFPENDVKQYHRRAIRLFLISLGVNHKEIKRENYPEFVSAGVYPEHHSMISVLSVGGKIFLVHTEGTCLTHKLQAENPEFADDDIQLASPKTIINISGVLSGEQISASVLSLELAHAVFPRSIYHIDVYISCETPSLFTNLSQRIAVSMNLYQLGAEETGSDGSVRKNIVIDSPLVSSDGTVFLANLLDEVTTMKRIKPGEEEKVVGSIRFDPVFDSDSQSTNMQEVD